MFSVISGTFVLPEGSEDLLDPPATFESYVTGNIYLSDIY